MPQTASHPLRILVLCGGSYVSGLEIGMLNLLPGLRERGHIVHVLISGWNDGDFSARLTACGIEHETIYFGKLTKSLSAEHLRWTWDTLRHLPGAFVRLLRCIRRFAPSVIILFNRDAALLASPLLRRRRCVYVVAELPDPSPWNSRLYRVLGRFVDHWIGVSSFIDAKLRRMGIEEKRITVVYYGVPYAAPVAQSRRRPFTIGICGQVGEWKGHGDLIESLGLLKQLGHEPRCLVFGSGDPLYVDSLKRRAASVGVANLIEWRGFVRDPEALYAELDALVVPSRFQEPFGLVAAEAGVRGLPVVASRQGGLPEIVLHGETGYLVDSGRADQIAERIADLMRDAELRRRMGAAGRRGVLERFTIDAMVAGYETVLQSVARS